MGTWGAGNFENDDAMERARQLLDPLIDGIDAMVARFGRAEVEEPDSRLLLADLEILCVLAKGPFFADRIGRAALPAADTVRAWKRTCLEAWDRASVEWDERRAVIDDTFDRLARLAKACPWVREAKPPAKPPESAPGAPGQTVVFEGLTLSGPEDIKSVRESKNFAAGDQLPWEWVARFCKAHPDRAAWVDEAFEALVREAAAGGELTGKRFETVRAVCPAAAGMGRTLPRLTGVLREQILAIPATMKPDKVRQIVGGLVGLGLGGGARVDDALGAVLVDLGKRTGCFETALAALSNADPALSARLMAEGLASALKHKASASRSLSRFAVAFAANDMRPHRRAIAPAIAALPAAVRQQVRDAIAGEAAGAATLADLDRALAKPSRKG